MESIAKAGDQIRLIEHHLMVAVTTPHPIGGTAASVQPIVESRFSVRNPPFG